MKKKYGYTLAEVVVSIIVIGVISAVTLPMIMSTLPNKNAIMIKKAYYSVDNIVKLLINDSYYYPDMKSNCIDISDDNITPVYQITNNNNCYLGFDYADNLPLTVKSSNGIINNGNQKYKLIYLFISYLDTKLSFSTYLNQTNNHLFEFVETTDGMTYKLDDLAYTTGKNSFDIIIDVNGKDGPNAYASTYDDGSNNGKTKCNGYNNWSPTRSSNRFDKRRFDRIMIRINVDGSIEIPNGQDEFVEIINNPESSRLRLNNN